MFTYKETVQKRREKIEGFLTKDLSAVAVIMAAANFEWTLRRAILALGKKPTAILRKKIEKTSNINRYKDLWKEEVVEGVKGLPAVIPEWADLRESYKIRNELVHGNKGTTGLGYARKRVDVFLSAAEALNQYVISKGAAIYGVRIRRVRERE
jgi:hypothetical protein